MREQHTDRQIDIHTYIQTDRQKELKYYIRWSRVTNKKISDQWLDSNLVPVPKPDKDCT